jgi:uncharacterized protein YbjQ (UPF0145 family)
MGWFSKSTDGFFLATTTPPDIAASQYLGVVNGEAIIGANIFRDMFSSVRDVVGGRAGGYERALSGARDAALEDLIAAARELGATGVIGIDFRLRSAGRSQRHDDGRRQRHGGEAGLNAARTNEGWPTGFLTPLKGACAAGAQNGCVQWT